MWADLGRDRIERFTHHDVRIEARHDDHGFHGDPGRGGGHDDKRMVTMAAMAVTAITIKLFLTEITSPAGP